MWEFLRRKKAEVKIRHYGFSFHSTPDELEELLIAHPDAEFVQLQLNYADWENPFIQSRALYEVARKYNKPIIVMEPLKGGLLANPPENVKKVFDNFDPSRSAASWGLRFVAGLEGVLIVLSGMSDIAQMENNISFMKDFTGLSVEETACLEEARMEYEKTMLIQCTSCDYCAKVCPEKIGISGTFTAMNHLILHHNLEHAKELESRLVRDRGKKHASECIRCGKCERDCSQFLKIREKLAEAVELFG